MLPLLLVFNSFSSLFKRKQKQTLEQNAQYHLKSHSPLFLQRSTAFQMNYVRGLRILCATLKQLRRTPRKIDRFVQCPRRV